MKKIESTLRTNHNAKLSVQMTSYEQMLLLVTLRRGVCEMHRWSQQFFSSHWESRRDSLYEIYRRVGGNLKLREIIVTELATLHHD